MDLRSDFPAGKEIFQKRCIHRGKPVLPVVKHSVFHEFSNTEYIQGLVTKLGATNPLIFVILFVGVQGAIEAVACTILGSAVSRALAAAFRQ